MMTIFSKHLYCWDFLFQYKKYILNGFREKVFFFPSCPFFYHVNNWRNDSQITTNESFAFRLSVGIFSLIGDFPKFPSVVINRLMEAVFQFSLQRILMGAS